MTAGTSGVSAFTALQQYKISRTIIYENESKLLHGAYIDERDSIESLTGNNKEYWHTYTDLPLASTLVEGITPEPTLISGSYKSATPTDKGMIVEATHKAKNLTAHDIMGIIKKLLMKSFRESIDADYRDAMNGATSIVYSGTATEIAQVTSGVTDAMITSMVGTLDEADARYRENFIDPTTAIGTVPVDKAYVAIVHTKLKPAIRALTGYQGREVYQRRGNLLPGEFGAITDKNIRFVDSTKAKVYATSGLSSADVYSILLIGMDAFGTTAISADRFYYGQTGFGEGEDTLAQRMRAGYRYNQATTVLNESNVVKGLCTTTVSQS